MKDDRGELDLTKRIGELENSLSIALEINDKFQRENAGLLKYRPIYLIKTFQDLDMNVLEQVTRLRYNFIKVV